MMRILFVSLLLLSIGCASTNKKTTRQEVVQTVKINLVFEKELKGEFFGSSLYKPFGIAVDFQGNIFISDAGNNRILKFDSLLNPIRQIGGFGSDDGLFNFPTYISFDNGLNLMISDEKNQRISRFSAKLYYVDEISFFDEDDPLLFGKPSGLTFTNFGEVWIADRDNNQIAIFNNIGKYSHSLGQFGYGGGQLSSPEKIVRNNDGDFLVCDAGNSRIVRYDEYANYLEEYSFEFFEYPSSITVFENKIFVLDSDNGIIYYLDENGKYLGEVASRLLGDKKDLLNPSDIILLSKDKVLITDTGNNRLVVGKLIIEE